MLHRGWSTVVALLFGAGALLEGRLESADALDEALARAKSGDKRVLLFLRGGEAQLETRLMAEALAHGQLARTLEFEYERVDSRDAPRSERFARDGARPALVVLDARVQRVASSPSDLGPWLTRGEAGAAPAIELEALREFLEEHRARLPDALELRRRAIADARAQGKLVFLRVRAPWSGASRCFDAWLRRAPVAERFAREFTLLEVDLERHPRASELYDELRPLRRLSSEAGLPWFALLDGEGRELAASDRVEGAFAGGLGFPRDDVSRAAFARMLQRHARKLIDADIAVLREELRDAQREYELALMRGADRR